IEAIEAVDIVLVTFNRLNFLKHTVEKIYERTLYPHRLWVVDNNSTDGTQEWLKGAKINGFVHDYVFLPKNMGLAYGLSEGFKKVKSEYFITTQDDVVPPDMRPCWLERMLHLAKENPDYGGIAMRIQRIRHRDVDEKKNLIESSTSLASFLRIQRREDIERIGGFGDRAHWESVSFMNRMKPLKKKLGVATHLYCDHTGFMPDNKGFAEGFTDYKTYAKERVTQGRDQPYPDIDPRTLIPLKINTSRDGREQAKRDEYWRYWGLDDRKSDDRTSAQLLLTQYAREGHGIDIGCGKIKVHDNAIGVDIYPYGDSVDVLANGNDLWMFKDGELDFVVASHSLEHFPDTKEVLGEWKRVLRDGGVMALAVVNGEGHPEAIRGARKVVLTGKILQTILKDELGMRIGRAGRPAVTPRRKDEAESVMIVATK
ncbi:glycosyltransferase, partial [Patescibacteria group bacterium]|nr:glycosyltransferase [Patescibacteria group bacterium]